LRAIAKEEGSVAVVVDLVVPAKPDGTYDKAKIANAQRMLLGELGPGARVVARYETTPRLGLEVTPKALTKLRSSPIVLAVHLDE
jgi:hypothetical protein